MFRTLSRPVLRLHFIIATFALLALQACTPDEAQQDYSEDEFGIEVGELDEYGKFTFAPVNESEEDGKSDSISTAPGLGVGIDQSETAVWEVLNQWEDTATRAAKLAGPAWGAHSGLDWEAKYHRWVAAMRQTASATNSSRVTFTMTTPWGEVLPAPSLECAEVAIFLRVTFASWYTLPSYSAMGCSVSKPDAVTNGRSSRIAASRSLTRSCVLWTTATRGDLRAHCLRSLNVSSAPCVSFWFEERFVPKASLA